MLAPTRRSILAAIFFSCAGLLATPRLTRAQKPATGPAEIEIGGAVAMPLVISQADLKKMPRTTLHVVNSHNHQTEAYEGVALEALLQQAGVPRGEALRGKSMALYVVAEAADDYRVVFSLAELDSSIGDSEAIVADTMNGAALAANEGPLKLVAPHDKRPARWVRMLKSITVVQAPAGI
jgi:DMSO/TMAO reductase YedYZ molybdopterin-dependent catalytic subunit